MPAHIGARRAMNLGAFSLGAGGGGGIPGTGPLIGGVRIGSTGAAGTLYAGYKLVDGDDFDTMSAADFLTPTNSAGAYMTTRHYGVQSSAPRFLRGAGSLGGYEADPWHTGMLDANRGQVPASYADLITFVNGKLKAKSRRATTQEKALMGPLVGKGALSSMIHMGRRNMVRAPLIMEMRLRFPYALAQWGVWHPTFWLLQSQPGNGFDCLEIDCEGTYPALDFNRNCWVNGSNVVNAQGNFGHTAEVSKTDFRTYVFKIEPDANGVWKAYLYEEGVQIGVMDCSAGSFTFDPTRPFHLMMTNHILQTSGYVQADWDAAGADGADMECDWWRAWSPPAASFRKPLVGHAEFLAPFNTDFSFTLPDAASVWGSGVASDVLESIPNEDNAPGRGAGGSTFWRDLLPPGVTLTGNVLAGKITDRPGRLILARSYTPAAGDGCQPQPLTVCIGPRVALPAAIDYTVGWPFSLDLYAACDCGDLHIGKTVAVTGLPAWANYSAATGLITGNPTNTGTGTLNITVTNSKGQTATGTATLNKTADAVASFTDNFNRAAGPLEGTADWTRVDGIAGGAALKSSTVLVLIDTTSTGTAYRSPPVNPGAVGKKASVRFMNGGDGMVCTRVVDNGNWFGMRRGSNTFMEVYACVNGSLILQARYGTTTSTNVMTLEDRGGTFRLLKDGVEQTPTLGSTTITNQIAMGREGLVARAAAGAALNTAWIDDFVIEPLAA